MAPSLTVSDCKGRHHEEEKEKEKREVVVIQHLPTEVIGFRVRGTFKPIRRTCYLCARTSNIAVTPSNIAVTRNRRLPRNNLSTSNQHPRCGKRTRQRGPPASIIATYIQKATIQRLCHGHPRQTRNKTSNDYCGPAIF